MQRVAKNYLLRIGPMNSVTKDRLPEDDNPVAIWPSFHGRQFAVWNKHEECWDDETADDFLCHKDEVEKWFPINWGGAE